MGWFGDLKGSVPVRAGGLRPAHFGVFDVGAVEVISLLQTAWSGI